MFLRTAIVAVFILALSSCGDGKCRIVSLTVTPASSTADHAASAPGNQADFIANGGYDHPCSDKAMACWACTRDVTWSASDPSVSLAASEIGISAVKATCTAATAQPVTLTATYTDSSTQKKVTGTATLTCQ